MLALAYLDIGLGIYALLLLQPEHVVRKVSRPLQKMPLLAVFVAVLIAASVWPLIIVAWLLSRSGDHD